MFTSSIVDLEVWISFKAETSKRSDHIKVHIPSQETSNLELFFTPATYCA